MLKEFPVIKLEQFNSFDRLGRRAASPSAGRFLFTPDGW